MPAAARYLRAWFASTFALLCVVVVVNLVVDPYGIFRIVEVTGVNRIKSQASERGQVFKRSGVERMRPKSLILGNSRAEIGFDPESPAWPAEARPVFNLALPGAGMSAVAAEFAQAVASATPRLAVVGLDFVDFRVEATSGGSFNPRSQRADPMQWLRERATALLTLSALGDSLATVKAQHEPYPAGLTDAGFNPKRDYIGVARREGYFAMFRQRDQENALAYLRGPKSVVRADGRPAPGFEALEHVFAVARERRIALRLVIYPYHAHTLMLFHLTGLWPAYEDWKRELVRRADAARDTMDVELWDFTGFAPFADERVPRPGDTDTELQWYWEAGHFKKSLGDLVLEDVLKSGPGGERWGRRLTGKNVEEQLRAQRAARDAYDRVHAEVTSDLASLVAEARRR